MRSKERQKKKVVRHDMSFALIPGAKISLPPDHSDWAGRLWISIAIGIVRELASLQVMMDRITVDQLTPILNLSIFYLERRSSWVAHIDDLFNAPHILRLKVCPKVDVRVRETAALIFNSPNVSIDVTSNSRRLDRADQWIRSLDTIAIIAESPNASPPLRKATTSGQEGFIVNVRTNVGAPN